MLAHGYQGRPTALTASLSWAAVTPQALVHYWTSF